MERAQAHVHHIGDAIQPSQPLSSLLLPSLFSSIRVFSNESVLLIRWPKYWSWSFSISPSNEYSGLISFRIDWLISLQSKGLSRVFSNTTVQSSQILTVVALNHLNAWPPTDWNQVSGVYVQIICFVLKVLQMILMQRESWKVGEDNTLWICETKLKTHGRTRLWRLSISG